MPLQLAYWWYLLPLSGIQTYTTGSSVGAAGVGSGVGVGAGVGEGVGVGPGVGSGVASISSRKVVLSTLVGVEDAVGIVLFESGLARLPIKLTTNMAPIT